MSDKISNDEKKAEIEIPSSFFIDSRMLPSNTKKGMIISRVHYENALSAVGSHFPEKRRRTVHDIVNKRYEKKANR